MNIVHRSWIKHSYISTVQKTLFHLIGQTAMQIPTITELSGKDANVNMVLTILARRLPTNLTQLQPNQANGQKDVAHVAVTTIDQPTITIHTILKIVVIAIGFLVDGLVMGKAIAQKKKMMIAVAINLKNGTLPATVIVIIVTKIMNPYRMRV